LTTQKLSKNIRNIHTEK